MRNLYKRGHLGAFVDWSALVFGHVFQRDLTKLLVCPSLNLRRCFSPGAQAPLQLNVRKAVSHANLFKTRPTRPCDAQKARLTRYARGRTRLRLAQTHATPSQTRPTRPCHEPRRGRCRQAVSRTHALRARMNEAAVSGAHPRNSKLNEPDEAVPRATARPLQPHSFTPSHANSKTIAPVTRGRTRPRFRRASTKFQAKRGQRGSQGTWGLIILLVESPDSDFSDWPFPRSEF